MAAEQDGRASRRDSDAAHLIGDEELLDVLSSNLCRCTGYQNIIAAVRAAADEMRRVGAPA